MSDNKKGAPVTPGLADYGREALALNSMAYTTANFYAFSRAWAAVVFCAVLSGTFIPCVALAAGSGSSIKLKLDYDLVPKLAAPDVDTRSLVDNARPAVLQSRVLKVQDQVRSLAQSNEEKARLLAERQRILAGIQGIVRAQDKMIVVLETEIARPAPRVQVPVTVPPPAPRPVTATAAPARAEPLRIGPVEVPTWIEPWLTEGALGLIIVVLLGFTFHLRASARAKDAELAALSRDFMPTDGAALTEVPLPTAAETVAPAEPGDERSDDSFPVAAGSEVDEDDHGDAADDAKVADDNPVKEIDTLTADGNYEQARYLLQELVGGHPDNPEFRLRMLHIESLMGDGEKAADEEQILSKMMEGPLSDTMSRVRELGRGLLPGHPLFDDEASADEAKRILDEHDQKKLMSDTQTDDLDAEREADADADADSESMDFLSDIFGDDEELAKKFSEDTKPSG